MSTLCVLAARKVVKTAVHGSLCMKGRVTCRRRQAGETSAHTQSLSLCFVCVLHVLFYSVNSVNTGMSSPFDCFFLFH